MLRDVPPGDARLLPGKLAGVFDVRRQLWRRLEYVVDPHQNQKVLARELVAELPRHSLLLFDLGYFAFPWFDDLTDDGVLWVSRLRDKTSTVPSTSSMQTGIPATRWSGWARTVRTRPSTPYGWSSSGGARPCIAI